MCLCRSDWRCYRCQKEQCVQTFLSLISSEVNIEAVLSLHPENDLASNGDIKIYPKCEITLNIDFRPCQQSEGAETEECVKLYLPGCPVRSIRVLNQSLALIWIGILMEISKATMSLSVSSELTSRHPGKARYPSIFWVVSTKSQQGLVLHKSTSGTIRRKTLQG